MVCDAVHMQIWLWKCHLGKIPGGFSSSLSASTGRISLQTHLNKWEGRMAFKILFQDFCKSCVCLLNRHKNGKEEGGKCNKLFVCLLSSFNCLWIAAGTVVQPHMGMEGAFCCRCSIAEPAEPPRNPPSIPLPISSKICRTKCWKDILGFSCWSDRAVVYNKV